MIKSISADFDCKVNVDDSGEVKIFAPDGDKAAAARLRVEEITAEAEIGKIYNGIVKTIVDFGAFVEILPGTDGLVHISELEDRLVNF